MLRCTLSHISDINIQNEPGKCEMHKEKGLPSLKLKTSLVVQNRQSFVHDKHPQHGVPMALLFP